MDDSQEDIAWLVVFFLEVRFHYPVERFFFFGEMGAQTSGRLHHGEAVIIFVQDMGKRQRMIISDQDRGPTNGAKSSTAAVFPHGVAQRPARLSRYSVWEVRIPSLNCA